MDVVPWLVAMGALLLASAFFSASEAALFFLSPSDLRRLAGGNRAQRTAADLLDDPDRLLTAVLFWNLVVNLTYFALAAARVATILMYVGVREVRLLNGGHRAWLAAGLPLEKGKVEVEPATEFGSVIPARPEYLVGTERAKEILADPGARLISVRSWAEFTGDTSGYRYIQAKGRIPGATWGFAPPSDGRMEDFRNPVKWRKPFPEF